MEMALLLEVREALELYKQEGGFEYITYGLKWRDPYWGIKPPLRLGNPRLLRLTTPPPLPQWLVLALALLLAAREALELYEQEGAFKDLTEGSDGRAPYWGNKYSRRFKTDIFDPANDAAVADASTAEASAAVAATGWIICLEAFSFTLDVMVQKYVEFSFLMTRMKGDVFVIS